MNSHNIKTAGHRWGARHRQEGVSVVLVTVSLVVLIGFMALAVDVGNLYVARNELHNAADAGSLAGARFLYVKDGSWVNDGTRPYDPDDPADPFKSAEARATEAAEANNSQNTSAEVLSARRGHWSFGSRTFTPDSSVAPVDLFEKSTAELDIYDPIEPFINAVEVETARQATPVETFFARVLGINEVDVTARSVAYIGFTGTLQPEEVDQPIALCKQALLNPDGNYSCDVGRFIPEGDQTGGWTNLQHDTSGATNANEIRSLVCGDGNPDPLRFGEDIATNNGQVQSAFSDFYDCWVAATGKEVLWQITLPVVDCESGVSPSNQLLGAVTVNVVWVIDGANKIDDDAPWEMELPPSDSDGVSTRWSNDSASGVERWNNFVSPAAFNLQKPDGGPADWDSDPQESGWRQKTIYFAPSCSYHEPKGQTGGTNFGILAKIPVLVD